MLGVRVADGAPVKCRPGVNARPAPVGLDPGLDRVSGLERVVDGAGAQTLAAIGVGEADIPSHREDDRVIDAVASRGPVAAADIAHEIGVGITPLQDAVVGAHHGRAQVGMFAGEERRLAVVVAVGCEAHLQRGGLAIEHHRLLDDGNRNREGGLWRRRGRDHRRPGCSGRRNRREVGWRRRRRWLGGDGNGWYRAHSASRGQLGCPLRCPALRRLRDGGDLERDRVGNPAAGDETGCCQDCHHDNPPAMMEQRPPGGLFPFGRLSSRHFAVLRHKPFDESAHQTLETRVAAQEKKRGAWGERLPEREPAWVYSMTTVVPTSAHR